jgi:hypothetical protein
MSFIPTLVDSQVDAVPLQQRLTRTHLESGQRWEEQNEALFAELGQALTYRYTDFENDAPSHHKTVAELKFREKSDQEIASVTSLRLQQVRKILQHPPVAQWVARMRLRMEELTREYDGKKYELASEAFEVQAAVVRGEEKVNRERLAAVLDAQKKDPAGRFQHYAEKTNRHKVVGTDDLREHIENARRRLQIDATVMNEPQEQSDGFEQISSDSEE